MAGIFKAYDIRGIYGQDLDDETATRIGRAFATFLNCRKVVVGRDIRSHSNALFTALANGLTEQGADVIDLGLCSTPMTYHANGKLGADAGVMITASHNPAQWNGFKLCRENAIPISGDTGIQDIERIVNEQSFAKRAAQPGSITEYDVKAAYAAHVGQMADLARPVRVAIDYANGMGILEAEAVKPHLDIDPLYDTLDGTFPNHEANPLKAETLTALQEKMRHGGYDFGAAFDGDADRVGFLDEKGAIIPMDMITALIAASILKREKGTVLYDLRSSWAVKEIIEENGGTPKMCRVGHAFIKQTMREEKAVYAGELSGHYYFRENYYTESGAMAVLHIANIVAASDTPLSELLHPFQRYHASGEINSEVADIQAVFARLREQFGHGAVLELDGLSIEFDDWWFNVRPSNTEPLVRLNLEARTQPLMEQRRDELLTLIRK